MQLLLAPMEGVVDHTMRDMLTAIGGLDRCVTEFVRVTNQQLPKRVFYRLCPELLTNGKTASGTPVYVQLLGSNPSALADNAAVASILGAPGIDINFGCPAKTVNQNDGGAILLREPERVYSILSAVRRNVPSTIPVTAKVRLGYEDSSLFDDICSAIFEAKATELVIHARTKKDGYKPPAYWHFIKPIHAQSPIPLIANGEIWTVEDAIHCIEQSDCHRLMLGRGILANPQLALQIRQGATAPKAQWQDILVLLLQFADSTEQHYSAKYVGNRVKQWLAYLRLAFPEANSLFEKIKRLTEAEKIRSVIIQHHGKTIDRAA